MIERQGRYLITQRSSPRILAGLWEFPSAKVEPGESDAAALQRELRERIGVEVRVGSLKARRTHFYVGYSLERVLYDAQILPGHEPRPLHVADFRWVAAQELEQYPFPTADQPTVDTILGIVKSDDHRASEAARPGRHTPTTH